MKPLPLVKKRPKTHPSASCKAVALTEKEFATQVEDLFAIFGWRWTHFRPAWSAKGYRTPIQGYKGFPDYVAVRNGMCLFIELKGERGKLSPDQAIWMAEFKSVASHSLGVMAFVWKPSDLDESVMAILR